MRNTTIGFIGGGRITRIFLEGWKRQTQLPSCVTVSDCSNATLQKLKTAFPGIEIAAADSNAAAVQDIVFLAVHPPVMAEVTTHIKDRLKPTAIVVSLAPKFTLSKLSELLGGLQRIARVIPNAPSLIGAGSNPISFASCLTDEDRSRLIQLLQPLGECPEVVESQLEAFALLTGMGPTYLWFQLEALRELARTFGLSDAEITPALKSMVCGTTRTLLHSGLPPHEVMDLIPVKPLAADEPAIRQAYEQRLPELFSKISP